MTSGNRFVRMMVAGVAVALVGAALAYADTTVTLKRKASVKGPEIFLGDVADIEGAQAAALKRVKLATAPLPGTSTRIDAALVRSRLDAAGASRPSVKLTGAPSVHATTLALEITADMLREDLRHYIQTQMPWKPDNATIDVEAPVERMLVPDGRVVFRWRPASPYNYIGTTAFRGEIRVDGALQKVVLCRVNIEAYGNVVVAARDISSGHIISPADVKVEKRLLDGLSQDGYTQNPDDVVGSVARGTLFAGQPVAPRDVMPRMLIKRGDLVPVEVRMGGLVARSLARAKSDAREGDTLICINPETKQEMQGTVSKDGVLEIQ